MYRTDVKEVWIVYHDSGPDNNILGVFNDEDEAYAYQEAVADDYPNGALLTPSRFHGVGPITPSRFEWSDLLGTEFDEESVWETAR